MRPSQHTLISIEKLKETRRDLSDHHHELVWYAIAQGIIIMCIGFEWWQIYSSHESTKADAFFQQAKDDTDGHQVFNRVIQLGHFLFALQHCVVFYDFLRGLRTKNVEDCHWELSVAHRFLSSGYTVQFTRESGTKGEDFDIVVMRNGTAYQVEVKNRQNNENEVSGLENTLKKARRQFIKGAHGIVFASIPTNWINTAEKERDIERCVTGFLSATSRVMFVVLEWIQWHPLLPQGSLGIVWCKTFPLNRTLGLSTPTHNENGEIEVFTPSFWPATA